MTGEHRWALGAGIASTWRRFRADAGATPRAAWDRWFPALAVGLVLTTALLAGLTLLARRHAPALDRWDREMLWSVVEGPFFSFQVAIWWEAFGASSVLVPLVALSAVTAARARRPLLALTFAASYLCAKPIILVGWNLWDRARPRLVADGLATPPFHSFPSGHALQAVAIYGLLAFLWMRRSRSSLERLLVTLLWLVLVTIVGLARVRMGTHWPSDVIAGSVVGVAWLATLLTALRGAEAAGGR